VKYIPTEEFLKECGFKNYNEDFERLNTPLTYDMLYSSRYNLFYLGNFYSTMHSLNIQSDSDLITFLKIINQNKV